MDLGLRDKTVLVTGGSRGIGRATALAYAQEGARVVISYRSDREQAEKTADDIEAAGAEALIVYLDLGDFHSIKAATGTVVETWGGIDVLVANAVHWPSTLPGTERRFEDVPAAEWQQTIRGNVEGTIATVQAVLPGMRGRPDARIVLVSSDVARHGFPGSGYYGASKAALVGLQSALMAELKGEILVNIVAPGFTVTERNLELLPQSLRDTAAGHTPTQRLSVPEDIAKAVVFLGSPVNHNIAGELLNVTGGA